MNVNGVAMGFFGALIIGTGWGLYRAEPPKAQAVAAVVHDDIVCRAKFSNWLMRHEELSKPEKERWESYKDYMKGCL